MHWNIRRTIAAIGLVGVAASLASPASAQTPSLIGSWKTHSWYNGYSWFAAGYQFLAHGIVKQLTYSCGPPSGVGCWVFAQKTGQYQFSGGTLTLQLADGSSQQFQISFVDSNTFTAQWETYYRVQ